MCPITRVGIVARASRQHRVGNDEVRRRISGAGSPLLAEIIIAFGGLDTCCVCQPIVHFFMLVLHVLGKPGRSDAVVRLWLGIKLWRKLRLWPWLVLPAFLVWAQEMGIVVDWRRLEIWLKTEVNGTNAVQPVGRTFPAKMIEKQPKNHGWFFSPTVCPLSE